MRTSHSWQSYLRTVVTPRSPWARLCTSPRAGGRHGVCRITIPFAPSSRGHGKKVPNRHRQRTVYPFSSLLSSSRDIHGAADEVTQVRAVPERSIAQNKYEMGAHSALFSIGQWRVSSRFYCRQASGWWGRRARSFSGDVGRARAVKPGGRLLKSGESGGWELRSWRLVLDLRV